MQASSTCTLSCQLSDVRGISKTNEMFYGTWSCLYWPRRPIAIFSVCHQLREQRLKLGTARCCTRGLHHSCHVAGHRMTAGRQRCPTASPDRRRTWCKRRCGRNKFVLPACLPQQRELKSSVIQLGCARSWPLCISCVHAIKLGKHLFDLFTSAQEKR